MVIIKDVVWLVGVLVVIVFCVINNLFKVSEVFWLVVYSVMEFFSYYLNVNVCVLVQQIIEMVGLVVGDVFDLFFGVMVKAVE